MSEKFNIENNKNLKGNPFEVPSGYFENIEASLQNLAVEESKIIPLNTGNHARKYLSLAASLLLLISATWYFWPEKPIEIADLQADEIETLVANGFVYDAEMAMLETLDAEDLDVMDLNSDDLSGYYQSTQPELIEDYYINTDDI